jgi:hypothetical protein
MERKCNKVTVMSAKPVTCVEGIPTKKPSIMMSPSRLALAEKTNAVQAKQDSANAVQEKQDNAKVKKQLGRTMVEKGTGSVDANNRSWNAKVQTTKEKLAMVAPNPAIETTSSNTNTSSVGNKSVTKKDSGTNAEKPHSGSVATAVGDILVERLLDDHPKLLDSVSVLDWEILLELPVPIMVELLEIIDGQDNVAYSYDWSDIWMHVCNYHLNK